MVNAQSPLGEESVTLEARCFSACCTLFSNVVLVSQSITFMTH